MINLGLTDYIRGIYTYIHIKVQILYLTASSAIHILIKSSCSSRNATVYPKDASNHWQLTLIRDNYSLIYTSPLPWNIKLLNGVIGIGIYVQHSFSYGDLCGIFCLIFYFYFPFDSCISYCVYIKVNGLLVMVKGLLKNELINE